MRKLIIILLFCTCACACSVVKEPKITIDSTYVIRDSIHTTINGKDSIMYQNRQVRITQSKKYTFKPLFWYMLAAGIGVITIIIFKR